MSSSTGAIPGPLNITPKIPTSGTESNIFPEEAPAASLRSGRSLKKEKTYGGIARRTVGILLLLSTVFLWTASNFLASTIFADDSFSKPYFVTYVNTSFFSVFLVGTIARKKSIRNSPSKSTTGDADRGINYTSISSVDDDDNDQPKLHVTSPIQEAGLSSSDSPLLDGPIKSSEAHEDGVSAYTEGGLTLRATAKLSLEFCILWFAANYFISACLEYTTVASSTILMSTSSIWTLLFGAVLGVERFTPKKLIGVLASLAGIALISTVDLSGSTNKHRGSFPKKTPGEIAIGDILALGSAVLYGIYSILLKKRIGNESNVNMLLFFGFVGLFNMILLWPGFLILHFTGLEEFELPPAPWIWTIVIVNSIASLVSDVCWAYAIVLTSPLVVTVGLSLSIPLSLIGQIVINSQQSSFLYWVGAGIVFISFIYINQEGKDEEITS